MQLTKYCIKSKFTIAEGCFILFLLVYTATVTAKQLENTLYLFHSEYFIFSTAMYYEVEFFTQGKISLTKCA